MKAVGYLAAGSIDRKDALVDLTLPDPLSGPRDLLVRERAVSVNPVDVKVRVAMQPAEGSPRILGFDAAGVVEAMGNEVSLFRPGDEVFYAGDITRPGTNAELHAVDECIVGHRPRSIGWAESAALPLTSITAWEAIFDRLDVSRPVPGTSAILIVGGGGVGSIAVQLAKALSDLTVVATGVLPEGAERLHSLGADHIIDYRQPLDVGYEALGIEAPGFVFSTTHTAEHLPEFVRLIAPQGRIALIDDPQTLDVVSLKSKMLSIHWEYMFGRAMYRAPDMIAQHHLLNEVARPVGERRIVSTLTQRLSPICAETLREAHMRVEKGTTGGKLVLEGWG